MTGKYKQCGVSVTQPNDSINTNLICTFLFIRHVSTLIESDVSEEHIASILRIEE
jgi:hypothetical protein